MYVLLFFLFLLLYILLFFFFFFQSTLEPRYHVFLRIHACMHAGHFDWIFVRVLKWDQKNVINVCVWYVEQLPHLSYLFIEERLNKQKSKKEMEYTWQTNDNVTAIKIVIHTCVWLYRDYYYYFCHAYVLHRFILYACVYVCMYACIHIWHLPYIHAIEKNSLWLTWVQNGWNILHARVER